jgi:hypothetical protein
MLKQSLILLLAVIAISTSSCSKKEAANPTPARVPNIANTLFPDPVDGMIYIEAVPTNPGKLSLEYGAKFSTVNGNADAGTVQIGTQNVTFASQDQYRNYFFDLDNNSSTVTSDLGANVLAKMTDSNFGTINQTFYNPKAIVSEIERGNQNKWSSTSNLKVSWTPDPNSLEKVKIILEVNNYATLNTDSTYNVNARYYEFFECDESAGAFTIPASTWTSWPKNTYLSLTTIRGNVDKVVTNTGKHIYLGGYSYDSHGFTLVP